MWIVLAALIAAIPASIAAVATMRGNKQLKPNGGSSLRDATNRIESITKELQSTLAQHGDRLDAIEDLVTRPVGFATRKVST